MDLWCSARDRRGRGCHDWFMFDAHQRRFILGRRFRAKGAWDTLIWFAILIGMSQQLNDLGVIECSLDLFAIFLISWNLVGTSLLCELHLAYF